MRMEIGMKAGGLLVLKWMVSFWADNLERNGWLAGWLHCGLTREVL